MAHRKTHGYATGIKLLLGTRTRGTSQALHTLHALKFHLGNTKNPLVSGQRTGL